MSNSVAILINFFVFWSLYLLVLALLLSLHLLYTLYFTHFYFTFTHFTLHTLFTHFFFTHFFTLVAELTYVLTSRVDLRSSIFICEEVALMLANSDSINLHESLTVV